MGSQQERANRVPVTDWAEVVSYPAGLPIGVGHLHNISEGGMAIDLPVFIEPGTGVQIRLSTFGGGLLRHFQFTGSIVHAEQWGQGGVHGIQFVPMAHAKRLELMDYLCEVEIHYRAAS
ncbi:MAG TPA: PilZ domain-containing protein [Nitrospiraceae bacterium]|nr:PilZ domain-containing protein [Nitrospiraceae bacterium]